MKYRIVEYKPRIYAIQIKHWFWWCWHAGDYGIWRYDTVEDAESTIRLWQREALHKKGVVKEF
jgi:hypothetical protein